MTTLPTKGRIGVVRVMAGGPRKDVSRVRRSITMTATFALMAGSLMTTGDAARSAVCDTWGTVASVPGNIRLTAVAALASNDVWAAGQIAESGAEAGINALVEHWDGVTWGQVAVPASDVWQGMNGLTAIAPDDVWGVGWASANHKDLEPFVPLVEHWDGMAWSVVPSVTPHGATDSALVSVTPTGTGELMAVGHRVIDGRKRTLIERWDGTVWSIVPSPNPGTSANGLLGVVAASSSDRPGVC